MEIDRIETDWKALLVEEKNKEYYNKLIGFLNKEYQEKTIYPPREEVFNALDLTGYKDVKVVILGQDPYHGKGQSHGLAFSVREGIKIPPSLRNIYKELENDLGYGPANNGSLIKWANQGVLLLNTVLTVREASPNSHKNKGWEILTDRIIGLLNQRKDPIIFILWGNNAISKEGIITNKYHHIIKSVHPSPFSAYKGFFGSKPFSRTNEILNSLGKEGIDWEIDNI